MTKIPPQQLVQGIFLLIAAYFGATPLVHAQFWSSGAEFPGEARDDGAAFVIDQFAYCGTGVTSSFNTTTDFYRFDFSAGSWTSVASLPAGQDRQYACAFSGGGKGYLIGGFRGGEFLNDFWMYDPVLNTWTALPPMPGAPRSGATCFVIGQSAYIVGGKNTTASSLEEVWRYEMVAATWQQMNNLPFSSWRAGGTALNGKGYLAFGVDNELNFSDGLWEYDPLIDDWSQLVSLPAGPRNYAALYSDADGLIAFGGFSPPNTYHNDCWKYSITDGAWQSLSDLPADGRRGGMAFRNADRAYYASGLLLGGVRTNDTWQFDLLTRVDHRRPDNFVVSPNPTKQIIHWTSADQSKAIIRIFALDGKLIRETHTETSQNRLNVEDLARGTYFLMLETERKFAVAKFIKQ